MKNRTLIALALAGAIGFGVSTKGFYDECEKGDKNLYSIEFLHMERELRNTDLLKLDKDRTKYLSLIEKYKQQKSDPAVMQKVNEYHSSRFTAGLYWIGMAASVVTSLTSGFFLLCKKRRQQPK